MLSRGRRAWAIGGEMGPAVSVADTGTAVCGGAG